MELKDLKSAWETYSSQEVDKHRLGKEAIHEMLRTRTKTLVDRIDRNIRIGMWVLLAFIAYVLIDDLYFSEILIKEPVKYPRWMIPIDIFSNLLIITTYLFFVIRYLKIKRSFSIDLQLRALLGGILETIKTYRRMFYLALVILLINVMVSFIAGLYEGVRLSAGSAAGGLESLPMSKLLIIVAVGLAILVPLIALIFLLFRWGFTKLYGQYLHKLTETMNELDESEVA